MFVREDIIDCESWYHVVDYHYTGQDYLPSGIVHCDTGSIPQFFDKILRYPSNRYVVVSGRCDFGLHYQRLYPPYRDYEKFARQLITAENTDFGYQSIVLPSPINTKRCNKNHKYSLKCYRYTEATFDRIPDNVIKWFISNNTILDDPRIYTIPFGIFGTDGKKESGDKIFDYIWSEKTFLPREKELYVNFAFYTPERIDLFNLYQEESFATVENNVEHDQYLEQLAKHQFALCPPSNGWDSYRILECLYMRCIPIVETNPAMMVYKNLDVPVVFLASLSSITQPLMNDMMKCVELEWQKWNYSKIKLSYWKDKIRSSF